MEGVRAEGGRMERLVRRLPRPTRKMLRRKPNRLGEWREAVAKSVFIHCSLVNSMCQTWHQETMFHEKVPQ